MVRQRRATMARSLPPCPRRFHRLEVKKCAHGAGDLWASLRRAPARAVSLARTVHASRLLPQPMRLGRCGSYCAFGTGLPGTSQERPQGCRARPTAVSPQVEPFWSTLKSIATHCRIHHTSKITTLPASFTRCFTAQIELFAAILEPRHTRTQALHTSICT